MAVGMPRPFKCAAIASRFGERMVYWAHTLVTFVARQVVMGHSGRRHDDALDRIVIEHLAPTCRLRAVLLCEMFSDLGALIGDHAERTELGKIAHKVAAPVSASDNGYLRQNPSCVAFCFEDGGPPSSGSNGTPIGQSQTFGRKWSLTW